MIKKTNKYGEITISKETIISIIKATVAESGKVRIPNSLSKDVLERVGFTDGPVTLESNYNKLDITIALITESGIKLPEKSREIQSNVQAKVQRLLDIKPQRINIYYKSIDVIEAAALE